ncbi:MAG: 3'-5' exonuclease [Burkholderiales bacterium]
MSWLSRWLPRQVALPDQARTRLVAWRALPEPDLSRESINTRYVVVDVESSGLDARRDRLIALGAVAVSASRIALDDGFYVELRQEVVSDDANILVHRIGSAAQSGGAEPVGALLDFLEYVGKSPLVGFHAAFDESIISRATRFFLGEKFKRQWIDLAYLAPAICTEQAPTAKTLDDWTAAFGIANLARHHALADAVATAQLHLVLCDCAREKGLRTQRELCNEGESQFWLERRR